MAKLNKEQKRASRTRYKLKKVSTDKPRLSVFRSNKNLHVQLIDDTKGITIASASTIEKDFTADSKNKSNVVTAEKLGELIAKRALDKKVKEVIFDRGRYVYHGKVKALADSARKAGLKF